MHVGTNAPASSPVVIRAAAARTIRTATRAAAPDEACGLLLGGPGQIRAATVACNIAADPARHFEIDPAHLAKMHRRARTRGPAILGCWHSHPNGRPHPSRHDVEGASIAGWLWLIAVPDGGLYLWRWTGCDFEPVASGEASA